MRPLPALIFDLDGLLIDTEILYYEATRRLIRPYGYDVTIEEYTDWVGRHVSTAEFLEKFPLPLLKEEVRPRFERELYALFRTDTQLMPGVREFLEGVAAPYSRAIASATARPLIDELLDLAGLAEDFPIRVSAKDVPRGKPAPDVFLEAARQLGRPPAECVVFEDSPFGIQGAGAAGMRTVAVPNLFTRHCDFSLADRVVGNLLEVTREWLEG
jgi:HAD superfamily hydrolase (TIGR01509 family)